MNHSKSVQNAQAWIAAIRLVIMYAGLLDHSNINLIKGAILLFAIESRGNYWKFSSRVKKKQRLYYNCYTNARVGIQYICVVITEQKSTGKGTFFTHSRGPRGP